MSEYEHSTQATVWTFTADRLKELRASITAEACERIRQELEQDAVNTVSFLSPDEEWALVSYYATQMEGLSAYFEFSSYVKATAVTYLKRFYLRHSVMDYHPKLIMLTCLFLATKACDHYISLDQFVRSIPKVTSMVILENEFLVCRALSWDFYVWHAYRPLHGFVLDMQVVLPEHLVTVFGKLHDDAKILISKTLWTDLQFLHSPSRIALGCLMAVGSEIVQTYLQRKGMQDLLNTIQMISQEIIIKGKTVLDMEEVKEIDRRLFYCSDKVKKSRALYAKRQVEEEEESSMRKQPHIVSNDVDDGTHLLM